MRLIVLLIQQVDRTNGDGVIIRLKQPQ